MKKKVWYTLLALCCFWLLAFDAAATHNRAGEIIYTHISGLTYEIRIITVTKATSTAADRPYLKIKWGDEPNNVPTSDLDSLARVSEEFFPSDDIKVNTYVGLHTYSGPGVFTLYMEDPNRNLGVVNLPNSINSIFTIRSVLVISPDTGHNNSVRLLNPAFGQACINQPWIHNPAAFDPDGDQLRYSIVPCLGGNGEELATWIYPSLSTSVPTDIFAIDEQTGNVTWIVPPLPGEFNFGILIEEFRNGIFVGSVLRDMQIDVVLCSNQPPVINNLEDYCVLAGEEVEFQVTATDPDFDDITLNAYGGPLTEVVNEAEWNPLNGQFAWRPECEEIRATPYNITFEAIDDGFVNLVDLTTISITVVAPRVENPTAEAFGNSITLNWEPNVCGGVLPSFQQDDVVYKIYRRNELFNFEPAECELGVPGYTGYVLIDQVNGLNTTTYTDNSVVFGGNFCYMIVTCFPDGAVSYASEEFCAVILKDSPVITKVSIGTTDISLGVDTVWWSPPVELDTLVFTGPYQYKVYRGTGFTTPDVLAYESSISPFLVWGDTTFVDNNLSTLETGYTYRVDFFANGELVTSSNTATSVFLTATPNDNEVNIVFNHDVPWQQLSYDIYRKAPGEADFSYLETTIDDNYTDDNLENNELYCYKVLARGTYNTAGVLDPLWNWSQEICAQPYDRTPPCAPSLTVTHDCTEGTATFSWNNPNLTCADDVQSYNLYRSATPDDAPVLLATFSSAEEINFNLQLSPADSSLAGCYYITALDSTNLWPDGTFNQNESELSLAACIDNCPVYELPNIFTPNADGSNDLFIPFPYRYVKDIELTIFNRWGIAVFDTTDRDIQWDGKVKDTAEMCNDGVYYYTITVNTIRLSGIVPLKFSGYVRLHDSSPNSNNP
jgi:gliding motility-associated-like protein